MAEPYKTFQYQKLLKKIMHFCEAAYGALCTYLRVKISSEIFTIFRFAGNMTHLAESAHYVQNNQIVKNHRTVNF